MAVKELIIEVSLTIIVKKWQSRNMLNKTSLYSHIPNYRMRVIPETCPAHYIRYLPIYIHINLAYNVDAFGPH